MKNKTRFQTINLPSGSPVYVGDRTAQDMDLSVITYTADAAGLQHISSIEELSQYKSRRDISWINISGLKDIDAIKRCGELFDIHPLSIEDILNTEQEPKIEVFETYKFLSIKTIQREKNFQHNTVKRKKRFFSTAYNAVRNEGGEFLIDQVSIIIMEHILITFQEIPGDSFDYIRKRILEGSGDIRVMGTDYLAYTIIDAIVDEYFLALNHLEEDIENFEDRAAKTSDDSFIDEIQDTKKYLLQIKRAISPLKEHIIIIIRHEKFFQFFQMEELTPFLQDLSEHINNAITTLENYREWLSNIMDVNLSVVSHQMNKVMKMLAMISTIFIPLTFIAGIYGMNFQFMPELESRWGYPIVLGGMGLIAFVMVIYFKIRRWF